MRVVCWLKVAKCVHRMNEVGVLVWACFSYADYLVSENDRCIQSCLFDVFSRVFIDVVFPFDV